MKYIKEVKLTKLGGGSVGIFLTEPARANGWVAGDLVIVCVPDEGGITIRKKEAEIKKTD